MSSPILICAQPLGSLRASEVIAATSPAFAPRPVDAIALPAGGDIAAVLSAASFDVRMRAAFGVVLVCDELPPDLRGTFAGEVSTRARQAGVACHLICAGSPPDPFTARIYDLQTITRADNAETLETSAELVNRLL